MFEKKAAIREKDFIGYTTKKKIKICASCISEAKRQLKKEKSNKSEPDLNEVRKIENDIVQMISALKTFKQGVSLDGSTYTQLVRILNDYYYRRVYIEFLLLILLFALFLEDAVPFVHFPIIDKITKRHGSVETMQVPGYDTQIVDEEHPYVQLKNVEDNTVYLKYSVYNKNKELLYESQLIAPGKVCDRWDAYKALKKGTHNIQFIVKAYDYESIEECMSAVEIPVQVVKK